MSVRTFRLKVFKCLRTPQQKLDLVVVELWLKMRDGTLAVMDREQDEQDLGWWGLENDSDVYVHFDTKS
jgi:tubulin-specific chaperone E